MSKPGSSDGFSLLEMLVVLAIFSLAAGAAYNGMSWRAPRETLSTLSQKITHAGSAASLRAIAKGKTESVEVDVANRLLSSGQGENVVVPERFRISILTGAQLIEQESAGAIEFYGDGTSSGGEIVLLDDGGNASSIRIYWLTGAITVKSSVRP